MHRLRINPGWTIEYKLPTGPKWTIIGRSKARESTGFYIAEPGIFLDAGLNCRLWKPQVILITHTHFDHVGSLPSLLREKTHIPLIISPQSITQRLFEFVKQSWAIKVVAEKAVPFRFSNEIAKSNPQSGVFLDIMTGCWIPMEVGTNISLNVEEVLTENKLTKYQEQSTVKGGGARSKLSVTAVKCFHTMDDLGYIISEKVKRLRSDLILLNQEEIKQLAKSGQNVSEEIIVHHLAYLCDTTIRVFENENANLVWKCAVVMVECTFLEREMESEANSRGHICWTQLQPVVEAHPDNLFILFHFSMRYTDEEIRTFFSEHGQPSNVKLWLDDSVC